MCKVSGTHLRVDDAKAELGATAAQLAFASISVDGASPPSNLAESSSHRQQVAVVAQYGYLRADTGWSVRDRQGRWAGAHACSGPTCIRRSRPRPTSSFMCLYQGRRLGPLPKAWQPGRYEHGHGRIMRANGCVRCMLGSVQAAFDTCSWPAPNHEDLGRSALFSLSARTCCKARRRAISPPCSTAPRPKHLGPSFSESLSLVKTAAAALRSSKAAEQLPAAL